MATKRTYQFGKSSLTLEFGDLTTSNAQVLVSSDDYYLSMGGGVSASLLKAGGNAIALDAAKKVPAALGDVVVTTAGTLPAQYIFHVVTIGPDADEISPPEIVRETTKRCMQMLDTLQLCSIAFPAIGAGVAQFSYEHVAAQMSEVIADDLLKRETPVDVTIFLFDRFHEMNEMDFVRFFEEFAARVPRLANLTKTAVCDSDKTLIEEETEKALISENASATSQELKMRRVHNLRKLIGALEDQRYKLEERLIDFISAEKDEEVRKLRPKLHENEELRLGYLNELKGLSEIDVIPPASNLKKQHLCVFVSSTYKDLVDHRNKVKDQIVRRAMLFRGMEHFGADPSRLAPASKIVDEVRQTDAYLGIFGVRYGSVDQATGLSMTELEFNEAEASGKPMFLYVITDEAPIKVSDIESDAGNKVKLDSLKARILKNHTVYMFETSEDLARQVYEDLGKL